MKYIGGITLIAGILIMFSGNAPLGILVCIAGFGLAMKGDKR